jgi:hypothetical protein
MRMTHDKQQQQQQLDPLSSLVLEQRRPAIQQQKLRRTDLKPKNVFHIVGPVELIARCQVHDPIRPALVCVQF